MMFVYAHFSGVGHIFILKNPLKKSLVVLAWLDRQSDQHNDTQKATRACLNTLLFESCQVFFILVYLSPALLISPATKIAFDHNTPVKVKHCKYVNLCSANLFHETIKTALQITLFISSLKRKSQRVEIFFQWNKDIENSHGQSFDSRFSVVKVLIKLAMDIPFQLHLHYGLNAWLQWIGETNWNMGRITFQF